MGAEERTHSAKPWRRSSLQPLYIISGDDPEPIAALGEFSDDGVCEYLFSAEHSEANAALIIKAPKLAEALLAALNILQRGGMASAADVVQYEDGRELLREVGR